MKSPRTVLPAPEGEEKSPLGRRAFVTRMGAFSLGAVGATSLLAACGSDKPGVLSGRQFGSGSPGTLAADPLVFAARFANIRQDEINHVTYIVAVLQALGATPRPRPTFDTTQPVWNPTNATQLANYADALENTGTGAYLYAIQNNSPFAANANAAQAAAAIDLVEGRHAGFLNALTNRPLLTDPNPAMSPLDSQPPTTNYLGVSSQSQEVAQPPSMVAARAHPFLVGLNLNGGPALPGDNLAGATIPDILNYALLLEYLERDWYVKNVGPILGV